MFLGRKMLARHYSRMYKLPKVLTESSEDVRSYGVEGIVPGCDLSP